MKGWEMTEAARQYQGRVNALVPKRPEMLSVISDLAAAFTPERPVILDLGAGAGDVTSQIMEYRPGASAWLIDLSDEMLRLSRERFEGNPYIHILKHDLDTGLPDEVKAQQFDVAVSCFVMHHVEPEKRLGLYADVCSVLKPGGLFINGDRFRGESPDIADWEYDNFIRAMLPGIREQTGREVTFEQVKCEQLRGEEQMGDRPGTPWQMEEDLRQAGFIYVDCIWKYQVMAILAAEK